MRMSELPIAEPCHEAWDAMDRSPGARRFCDRCTKHVHDLSALTEPEARAVLASAGTERICVRYRVDGSGVLKFRANDAGTTTDLVPLRSLSRRRAGQPRTTAAPRSRHSRLAAGSAAVLAAALVACTPHHDGDAEPRSAVEVDGDDGGEILGKLEAPREQVLMGEPMPIEPGDAGQEAPCDPKTPTPPATEEVELMGDVAVEHEPEPVAEPVPTPVPEATETLQGRVGVPVSPPSPAAEG